MSNAEITQELIEELNKLSELSLIRFYDVCMAFLDIRTGGIIHPISPQTGIRILSDIVVRQKTAELTEGTYTCIETDHLIADRILLSIIKYEGEITSQERLDICEKYSNILRWYA